MIDDREVERIAQLARLRLEPGEVESMRLAMSVCLDHFAELFDVAASPFLRAVDREARGTRPDAPGDDPLLRPLSANAPDWRDDLFVVPRLPALGREAED